MHTIVEVKIEQKSYNSSAETIDTFWNTLSTDWFIKWLKSDILEWLSRYAHFLITNFLSFADYFLHFCFLYTTDVFKRCT